MPKPIRQDIDPCLFKERLGYSPETGRMWWKIKRLGRYIGTPAGTRCGRYIHVKIDGVIYLGHRVAWALAYGEWPQHCLDHIDGDGTNNRLSNLRPATQTQNACNKRVQSNSTTGVKGVYKHTQCNGYYSHVGYEGKTYYVGLFPTIEQAKKARDEFASKLHGKYARS